MPRDISLIGFDDYTWMRARATPLTAIFQPTRDMGRALWETLSGRIHGDRSPAKRVLLPCELRVRKSTGPVSRARPASHEKALGTCRDGGPMRTTRHNEFRVGFRPRTAGSIDPQLAPAANESEDNEVMMKLLQPGAPSGELRFRRRTRQPALSQPTSPTMGVVVKIGGIPWFNAMETGIKEDGAKDRRRRLHDRAYERRSGVAGARDRGPDRQESQRHRRRAQ